MKLEGSLDAFSLPDIFQLLSFTKKTGGLHLAHGGADGVIFFHDGMVTGASADSSRQPLARRLIGAGVVDDEALSIAVAATVEGDAAGVVGALLAQGSIDPALLRHAATDQAVDAVFDLLGWASGDFVFVVDEANADEAGVSLSVEAVLDDAASRQESWNEVLSSVSALDAVLVMPVVLPAEPAISREEWSMLALVDGRRTVGELVDLTGSGQYAVVSTLAGLVSRGLLVVRDNDNDNDDHVSVVVRRQTLLAPLEGTPFTPEMEHAEPAEIVEPVEVIEVVELETAADEAPAEDITDSADGETEDGADQDDADAGPADNSADPVSDQDDVASEGSAKDAEIVDSERDLDSDPNSQSDADADADADSDVDDDRVDSAVAMLGGAHVPGDVVPPRPEPFLPRRQADFGEEPDQQVAHAVPSGGDAVGAVVGAVALDPSIAAVIERDPNVNRSLMLRLIAGVRGL